MPAPPKTGPAVAGTPRRELRAERSDGDERDDHVDRDADDEHSEAAGAEHSEAGARADGIAGAEALSRVARELRVQRFLQPDDVTCGPTCLSKVYDFYGSQVEIDEVASAIERNEDGGTLAVFLAMAALRRGFRARIYSYDLQIFDPTWTRLPREELVRKVRARFPYLDDAKRRRTAVAYVRYLEMGGELAFEDLTPSLLKEIIDRGHPILAGLSATYLYGFMRERTVDGRMIDDDVAGEPTGHFVVISGYDNDGRRLTILDPSEHVPASADGRHTVGAQRLINAILLGDVTYDAVLLELWPAHEQETV